MGGVEGVRFIPLSTAGSAPDALTRLLLTGAVLRGRIAADGALLNLVVGNQNLPLPKGVALSPGTVVEARVTHEGGTPHLRLQVLDSSPQAIATRPQSAIPTYAQAPMPSVPVPPSLAGLLKPEIAAILLPKAAFIPPKVMEALLTMLASRPELGRALARLLPMVEAHTAEGPIPPERVASLRAAVQAMEAETPDEFRRAIEVARESIGARGELAAARTQGENASRSLLDDLLAIRDHLNARTTTADGREIVRTIDTLVGRTSANVLQNVRSLDAPYQFFAIPFSPRTGIEYAQVHVIGRDGRSGGGSGREAHLVVIDVQMTNLGSLWIAIQSTGVTCNCSIRASSDAARAVIDDAAPRLEDGLRRAGFVAAQVRTEAWDGDRAGAAAGLFAQTGAFEAEV